ncbi:MAG: ABC transporter ATP-binding protein [Bdellovibrionaceae bacterium]|nr:ABC transporter ATP-binding protein [Pseudobdellovibrionaceae bacterium]|tara:strand:- start:3678 stop:4355 length:678 start_codon:yes stop_codon:yes gene_type:complete
MIESIVAKNLTVQFGDLKVFENLNFEIQPGFNRIFTSVGRGKSVTLKLLAGSLMPNSGEIFYNGKDVTKFSFEEWSDIRLRLGYAFDFGGLLNNRTLLENLILPIHYHNFLDAEEAILKMNELLDCFGIVEDRNRRPSDVTGSQRKATCVARAMVLDPEVLLLDDPTTGLSDRAKEGFFHQVDEMFEKGSLKYVIYSSEDKSLISKFQGQSIDCNTTSASERKSA